MNTKKLFYGLFTCLILVAAACTPTSTAEEDTLYEVGVDKTTIKRKSVDKTTIKRKSVDKTTIKRGK